MIVKVIKSGVLSTNSYIISKDDNCIVIDPAFAFEKIVDYIKENNYKLCAILLTHGHFDHIESCDMLAYKYNCNVYVNKYDFDLLLDPVLNGSRKYLKQDISLEKKWISLIEKEVVLKIENFFIDIIFTPGHSKGSCCYLINGKLFSGDTLFYDAIGRVDLYGGNKEDMDKSLIKLFKLDENILVFPGHGAETTILKEKNRYI